MTGNEHAFLAFSICLEKYNCMVNFYFHPDQNKAYKINTEADGQTFLYYVQVKKFFDTKAFIHARGRDAVASEAIARQLIEAQGALPYTEEKYLSMMKDYFAIDKKVREQFIEKYKL